MKDEGGRMTLNRRRATNDFRRTPGVILHPSAFILSGEPQSASHWTLVPVGSKYADVADRVARHGSG